MNYEQIIKLDLLVTFRAILVNEFWWAKIKLLFNL